jgi:predicted TIM-barrel fold metal-dependent hydrolase
MAKLGRREWLASFAAAAAAASLGGGAFARRQAGGQGGGRQEKLPLEDYVPKSMLHVPETHVPRARFPAIDFHTHLSWTQRDGQKANQNTTPEKALEVMNRRNVRVMVNLTGGFGPALEENLRVWQRSHPNRFVVFTEPWLSRFHEPGYPRFQAEQIEQAARLGAKGIKVLKSLGLGLRENAGKGALVKVDDRRFDPMWEAAGAAGIPVAIHTSDPEAFFHPTDRFNERYEELSAHPDWAFNTPGFPSNRELHEARNRVVARHPRTHFVYLHVGNAEDLGWVSEWLDRYPNTSVEIGARIGELGRQPRASRKFFDKYQDRIMFGTDAVPEGFETPQQIFGDELYEIYYRFLETEDEYFDYAPAPKPPQGRWRIYGLGLPDSILRKVYWDNAARLLKLEGGPRPAPRGRRPVRRRG